MLIGSGKSLGIANRPALNNSPDWRATDDPVPKAETPRAACSGIPHGWAIPWNVNGQVVGSGAVSLTLMFPADPCASPRS